MTSLTGEVRAWIGANWSPDLTVEQWWRRAYDAGWLFPSWPSGLGGRDGTAGDVRTVHEVFAAEGVLGPPFGVAQTHGAPLVLRHGDDEQRRRLIPPVGLGLESWCQLFSEPDAGSDLAGIRTRAERVDGGWRVNGQKVWTSGAQQASRAILLARTDWSRPKHRGLSIFIADLRQPGIEIRPIRQMNGVVGSFNEVFLTDVHVDDRDLIGAEGDGWAGAMTTLAFERGVMNARVPGLVSAPPGPAYGVLGRPAGEVVAEGEAVVPYVRSRAWISSRALAGLMRDRGADDPALRHRLAEMYCLERAVDRFDAQTRAAQAAGQDVGVSPNIIKLAKSDLGRMAADLAAAVLGTDGLLEGDHHEVTRMILSVPSFSISGGTDEIQRNIIAERGLGLPRDTDPSRNRPFRQAQEGGAG